jgi:hypothetical protein
MATTLTIKNAEQFTQNLAVKILRRCANDLAVVQKEQVAESFLRSGQPGKKWPPLWADSFVGEVSEKKALAIGKAMMAFAKSRNGTIKQQDAKAKLDKARINANATSYRKGGQPLRGGRSGGLEASFFIKHNFVFESELSLLVVIASSNAVAKYHQTGFQTKGPNFIPLTLKAARNHVKGANPRDEGFEYGVDYIMAWKGVKVPERAMIDYADAANKAQIDQTIQTAMKG